MNYLNNETQLNDMQKHKHYVSGSRQRFLRIYIYATVLHRIKCGLDFIGLASDM